MRGFLVGGPDDAGPVGEDGVLGIPEIEEGEGLRLGLGGAKLDPLALAVPVADPVGVEGVGFQSGKFNGMVMDDNLGRI